MEAASPIGQKVRDWRVSADMSGAALALALGISRGKVSELEKGTFLPGAKVALRLEELSGGLIDASALNDDVRAARHGLIKEDATSDDRTINDEPVIECAVCEKVVSQQLSCPVDDCPFALSRAA